jgi:hypothetical protein
MKRSQSEIIGLLIIVIILSMVILFAMTNCKPPPAIDTTNKELASSMIGAMLNTNSGCTKDIYVKELLIDCAKAPDIGGTPGLVCVNGSHSCQYVEGIIQQMLDRTLSTWQKSYELEVRSPQDIEIMNFTNTATGTKSTLNVQSANQPLPVGLGIGQSMQIRLCIGGRCRT